MKLENFILNYMLFYAIPNYLIYAIYIICFALTLRLLYRKRSPGVWLNLALLVIQFACVTAYLVLNGFHIICKSSHSKNVVKNPTNPAPGSRVCRSLTPDNTLAKALAHGQFLFLVLCQTIGDYIILRRCYIVWGRRKSIIMVPSLLLIASFGIGLSMVKVEGQGMVREMLIPMTEPDKFSRPTFSYAFAALTIVTNILATGLTAGRIYYVAGRPGQYVDESSRKRYRLIIAMILESGMIYSFTVLIFLIGEGLAEIDSIHDTGPGIQFDIFVSSILLPIAVQTAGLAPTILLLRTNQREANATTVNSISEIRFPSRAAGRPGITSSNDETTLPGSGDVKDYPSDHLALSGLGSKEKHEGVV